MNSGPDAALNTDGKEVAEELTGFRRDGQRLKWTPVEVFSAACVMNSFGVINFSLLPVWFMVSGGVVFLLPYCIGMLLFGLPVFCLQAFLGQFSGTGLVAAYRIAPLYKAVSYFMIAFNLVSASCYAVFAAIPLIFVFSVSNTSAPWLTCDNDFNIGTCLEHGQVSDYHHNSSDSINLSSVVEYFQHAIVVPSEKSALGDKRIVFATIAVWIVLSIVMLNRIFIGKLLRLFRVIVLIFLAILLIRLLFLPHSVRAMVHFLKPAFSNIDFYKLAASPMLSVLAFGSGWGTILTLASYNDFKENIQKMSLIVFGYNLIIMFGCSLCWVLVSHYATTVHNFNILELVKSDGIYAVYYLFPYVFGKMETSNMWTVVFCLVLFLGELSSCIVQLLAVTSGIFDEHNALRLHKKKITCGIILVLACLSAANFVQGGIYLVLLSIALTGAMQMLLCFVELIVVGWWFGKMRLQRDIKFMTGKELEEWKLFILRFISPILALVAAGIYLGAFIYGCKKFTEIRGKYFGLMLTLKFLPVLIIPIYILIKMNQLKDGSLVKKWHKLCQRIDWYPTDLVQRQKYNENLENMDTDEEFIDRNQKITEI